MAGAQLKPPKVFKKHSKKSENRSTCWRSLKWKIAILCCYSHRRKGSSLLHNLLILAVVFSQVYLLHRFGLHRGRKGADSSVLMQMKRSYPLQSATSQLQKFFGQNSVNSQGNDEQPALLDLNIPPELPPKILELPKLPESQPNVPEFVPKLPESPVNMPELLPNVPESLPKMPELPKYEINEQNKPEQVESPIPNNSVKDVNSPQQLEPKAVDSPDPAAGDLESPKPLDLLNNEQNNPPELSVLPEVQEAPVVAAEQAPFQNEQEEAANLFAQPADSSSTSLLASIFFDIPSVQSVSPEKCHVLRSAPNPPKPMYEMDESKLLIPVLPWGAAEQMRGFRESLLMGFFMNRTVCVPPFWRERSPSAFKMVGEGLPAGARIDVDELSKLVNVCSLEEVVAKCGNQFTSVMLGQNICSKYTRKRIAELEQRLNFQPIYSDDDCTLAEGVKLSPPGFTEKMVKLQPNAEDVAARFPVSEDKCALWLYPYINFIESEKKLLIPFLTRASPPEGKWLKDIIKYTKRPKYVHQIVDDFFELHSLDKSNYLAIRWDFEKDFSDSCEKKKDDFFCNLTSNSTDAFRGLTNYVKQYNQKKKLKGVYVSTNSEMHEKIFTPLTTVWKAEFDGLIPLFTRDDLSPCVEKVNCMGVDLADAVDTAEIELCYRSAAFLRAQYSIWSRTIDLERRASHIRSLADKLFTDIVNK